MTDEEGALVKGGGIPEGWAAKPAKLAQKDRDARWTLKRGRRKKGPDGKLMAEIATPMFGYKSHIGIDQRYGFIRTWGASDAARYDGRAPGKPLPTQRQRANAARSKVRSAVEHVFATQKHRMGLFIRTIGIERARVKIGLANIAFNFKRFIYWETRASTA